MQLLLFLCRPHNLRILQPKQYNYSKNCSGRARFTNKVLEHVKARERWRWRFARLDDWSFRSVKNSEGTESSSAFIFVCFHYAIVTLLFMLILQKLCFYKEAVLCCFMLISLFYTSSKNGVNSRYRTGGSVMSTFQGVHIIHGIQIFLFFFYAIITLLFMRFLQGLCYDKDVSKEVVLR